MLLARLAVVFAALLVRVSSFYQSMHFYTPGSRPHGYYPGYPPAPPPMPPHIRGEWGGDGTSAVLPCRHPSGGVGVCTEYGSCKHLQTASAGVVFCKSTRLICCPVPPLKPVVPTAATSRGTCVSRKGERGLCMPLRECSLVFNEVKQHNSMGIIVNYKCGNPRENSVCCPFGTKFNIDDSTLLVPQTGSWNKTTHKMRKLLNEESCGITAEPQVVGGKTAEVYEFPWLALIYYTYPNSTMEPVCGGSLITPRYVLTAAHCIPKPKTILSHVVLGEFDTSTESDNYHGVKADPPQRIPVETIISHQLYDSRKVTSQNDIALLRLKHGAVLGRFVSTICLPMDQLAAKSFVGDNVEVAGWGRTTNDEPRSKMSTTKQHVEVKVIDNEKCRKEWPNGLIEAESKNQICTQGKMGHDSCTGDSGGPVMKREDGHWYVIGIISAGLLNCGSEYRLSVVPSINTRVMEYVDWILDHMES